VQAEKMATAGRLSVSIAHEVNNPLQAVQNCLHLAGRDAVPQAKRDEYMVLAQTELERLRAPVRRMLDFYRPGLGAQDAGDAGEIVRYISSLMAKQLLEARVELVLNLPEHLPLVQMRGSQIQQVFVNLVLNAMDAMPAGGRLEVTGTALDGGVELRFADTGPGIAPERQSSIFEPFYSTREGGTGLGLTVSYNIIAEHGGTLELLPDAGPGACFRVFLPAGGAK
jgi:signal transduction histidine kinase